MAPTEAVRDVMLTFVAPLHDTSWPDDELMELEFSEQK